MQVGILSLVQPAQRSIPVSEDLTSEKSTTDRMRGLKDWRGEKSDTESVDEL